MLRLSTVQRSPAGVNMRSVEQQFIPQRLHKRATLRFTEGCECLLNLYDWLLRKVAMETAQPSV